MFYLNLGVFGDPGQVDAPVPIDQLVVVGFEQVQLRLGQANTQAGSAFCKEFHFRGHQHGL